MIDFTPIKAQLKPPVKREILIEIMARGTNAPEMLKAMAYMIVNRMKQPELDNMGQLATQAIELFETGDFDGLQAYLIKHNIPPQIVKAILDYATHSLKI